MSSSCMKFQRKLYSSMSRVVPTMELGWELGQVRRDSQHRQSKFDNIPPHNHNPSENKYFHYIVYLSSQVAGNSQNNLSQPNNL